jgi:periplasmic divalent cation tolerance protein
MQQVLLVLTNLPDEATAGAMARILVERRFAACVNVLPAVRSVYQWQGAVEEAAEITMLIKTTQARYAELEAAIKSAHPYDVPEIIALPLAAGLPKYLEWVVAETKRDVDV